MTHDRKIKRGDLAPALTITVTDKGKVVDLTEAASVRVIGVMDGTEIIDRGATTFTELGIVTLDLLPGDTDTVGIIIIEVEIMWPGNKPQSVRTDNRLIVTPDLG